MLRLRRQFGAGAAVLYVVAVAGLPPGPQRGFERAPERARSGNLRVNSSRARSGKVPTCGSSQRRTQLTAIKLQIWRREALALRFWCCDQVSRRSLSRRIAPFLKPDIADLGKCSFLLRKGAILRVREVRRVREVLRVREGRVGCETAARRNGRAALEQLPSLDENPPAPGVPGGSAMRSRPCYCWICTPASIRRLLTRAWTSM